jgi:phosphoenolpyruvate carboxylase
MKEDYLARGFQKIHVDLAFLMHCFREVLEELGEQHLANNLPWISEVRIDLTPNPRLCQAYSIAFQLLNMVEGKCGRTDSARSGIRDRARR